MARINLVIYVDPGSAEVYLNVRLKDGGYTRFAAVVDMGAAVSLLPRTLLDECEYRMTGSGEVVIDQAGIAQQTFKAIEAYIKIKLEDTNGSQTPEMEIQAWFAETETALIGFKNALDKATLYVDMRQTRSGYIEFDD